MHSNSSTCTLQKLICMADVMADYYGTNAEQILKYPPRTTGHYSQNGERLNDMEHTPDDPTYKRCPETIKSLEALGKFTLPIVEHFINALNNEDKWVRYLAADALGNLGDLRSIPYLDPLRSDKDPDLRFISGQALR